MNGDDARRSNVDPVVRRVMLKDGCKYRIEPAGNGERARRLRGRTGVLSITEGEKAHEQELRIKLDDTGHRVRVKVEDLVGCEPIEASKGVIEAEVYEQGVRWTRH